MSHLKLPVCTSMAECAAHDGERVTVVGVYVLHEDRPRKAYDDESELPVRIMFGEEIGPYLEPSWHKGSQRPIDEIARCRDKAVRVTGVFHRKSPPPPDLRSAYRGDACLHPVEEVAPTD
jgi:hypothetical protein